MNYPELEIGLRRSDAASYSVELRFRDPTQEAELRAEVTGVRFDLQELLTLEADPEAYGKTLGSQLFGQDEIRSYLDKARTVAQSQNQRLRLRLCLDRWSENLQALRWETLRDPATGRSLLMDDQILFSRFLGSFDMRPVKLRTKTRLRALVAVANPSDLEQWTPGGRSLAKIDVDGELKRVRESLGEIAVTEIPGSEAVTLDLILKHLRDDYDVFYLVCHGALIDDEPRLWLQKDDGSSKVTAGSQLVDGLARLLKLPRLMVLASCQSGGSGGQTGSDDGGVLAALGPQLAEAGIPAVIAMQGNVLQETVTTFTPAFFAELLIDGQIDRAMTEARFAIRDQPDFWSPVLYTRLITGRLWYEHHFAKSDDFEIWDGLVDQLEEGNLIPILGPGLLDSYLGSVRELAHGWAERRNYPMKLASGSDLHEVAQYISTIQGKAYATNDYIRFLTDELLEHCPDLVSVGEDLRPHNRLLKLLSTARQKRADAGKLVPHDVLARLNCPLYLSTNFDHLLVESLEAVGKSPVSFLPHWNDEHLMDDEESNSPTSASKRSPVVAQLFGHLSDKKSLVLTEDDYFQYLIGVTKQQSRPQPSIIQEKLADSGLMFLGFRMESWQFRVLIHLLQSLQGSKLRGYYKNVAVQLDPEEGLGSDLGKVRKYLEKYFGAPAMQIEIYWGSAEDFLTELDQKCQG